MRFAGDFFHNLAKTMSVISRWFHRARHVKTSIRGACRFNGRLPRLRGVRPASFFHPGNSWRGWVEGFPKEHVEYTPVSIAISISHGLQIVPARPFAGFWRTCGTMNRETPQRGAECRRALNTDAPSSVRRITSTSSLANIAPEKNC